ncbi:hypothetical protein DFP73DRAFT_598740 [Morchella snyderi]|nr:hypothetical protein DFP73DRAFT_598740 [Morchella snyderi]
MSAAANCRVGCTVDLDEAIIKQVKGRLAHSTIYRLGNLSGPEAKATQAEYLSKNDRFLSPAQHYETYRLRFLAPGIIDILYYEKFDGVRMRGHGIRAWSTGTYVKPDHFLSQNENVVSTHPRSLTAITRALRAVKDALETTDCFVSETFNRMSNTWKGRSRQNQEVTLEVIKDNLREKIREKKGITIEVIPDDGFSEDDEALAADLAAFRNTRKSWFMLNLGALKRRRKGKRVMRSKKRVIMKEERRKRMCTALASALESTPERFGAECFGEHWERFRGECFAEYWEYFGGECFGEH